MRVAVIISLCLWVQGCSLLLPTLDDKSDGSDVDADAGDAEEDVELPPASSCAEILEREPDANDGEYAIVVGGDRVEVFCDMTNGGWTLVVRLDAAVDECPGDWFANADPQVCRIDSPGCGHDNSASAVFDAPIEEYSEVRGYARAYQYHSTDGFSTGTSGIEGAYVEGVSITYGSSPRHHIWTLAVGLTQMNGGGSCPCLLGHEPPAFIGDAYFCDSGNPGPDWPNVWYTDDPLWGGGEDSHCDVLDDPAWFETELDETTSEPIEVRILQDDCDENIGVYELELYVR